MRYIFLIVFQFTSPLQLNFRVKRLGASISGIEGLGSSPPGANNSNYTNSNYTNTTSSSVGETTAPINLNHGSGEEYRKREKRKHEGKRREEKRREEEGSGGNERR